MMLQVKTGFDADYYFEREQIGEKGIDEILEAGRKWDVSSVLKNGGVCNFPPHIS